MALNLGELYVQLSVKGDAFRKGMAEAAEAVEKASKKLQEVSEKVASVAARFTAFGAVMVNEASKYDRTVAKSVKGLHDEYGRLAVQVGQTLTPAVNDMTEGLRKATDWFRNLSPEAKAAIAKFAEWTVGIGAAAVALNSAGKALEVLSVAFKAALSPMVVGALGIAAAFLAVVAAIGAVKRELSGMESGMGKVGQGISRALRNPAQALGEGVIGGAAGLFGYEPERNALTGQVTSFKKSVSGAAGGGEGLVDSLQKDLTAGFDVVLKALPDKVRGLIDSFKGLDGATKGTRQEFLTLEEKLKRLTAFNAYKQGVEQDIQEYLNREGGERRPIVGEAAQVDVKTSATIESMGRNAVSSLVMGQKSWLQRIQSGLASLGDTAGQALIRAGQFFGSNLGHVAQSFAMGGLEGAIIALVSHSKGFEDVLRVLDPLMQALADVVGAVLTPLEPLIGALLGFVDAIAAGLQPAFDVIASILEPFVPVLVLVGEMFRIAAPALGMLLAAVQLVQSPMLLLASKAMPLFFEALKFVGGTFLRIVKFIAPVWNAVAGAVVGVVRGVMDAIISVLKTINPGGILNGIIRAIESMRPASTALQIDLYAVAKAIQDLEGLTWDAAMAKARENVEVLKGTEAQRQQTEQLRKMGEELTNVPEGFKVMAARYASVDAAGGPGGGYLEGPANTGIVPPIGLPSIPSMGPALEAALPPVATEPPTVNVYVAGKPVAAIIETQIAETQATRIFQRTGQRVSVYTP